MTSISMSQLWTLPHTIVDVRAPIEFQKGHIPGAVNVPLLDDEQRHQVGLCYRQQGREAAILLGLELVGPKMAELASEGVTLSAGQPLVVYCQRGGKRSQSMTWLWSQLGITVFRLEGGYKHFRQSVLEILAQPRRLLLLAGSTGVGKTDCLMQLKAQGESILDLEGIANHKGSAFGAIGEEIQPTQAQFENRMAWQLQAFSVKQSIWVEAESRRIGQVYLPDAIWDQMQQAPRIYIDRPREDRIDRLCVDYQSATTEELQRALFHIRKSWTTALSTGLKSIGNRRSQRHC